MIESPCRYCVQPVRRPGCLRDKKKKWDKQNSRDKGRTREAANVNGYSFDRMLSAKRRAE